MMSLPIIPGEFFNFVLRALNCLFSSLNSLMIGILSHKLYFFPVFFRT